MLCLTVRHEKSSSEPCPPAHWRFGWTLGRCYAGVKYVVHFAGEGGLTAEGPHDDTVSIGLVLWALQKLSYETTWFGYIWL